MSIINTALNALLPIYKKRIFVDGLDSNEQLIGTYDKEYKEYRTKKGLQASKVTLTNTGELKKSIVVVGDSIGFNDKEQKAKANRLTEKYGVQIFQFTGKELQFIYKFILENYAR